LPIVENCPFKFSGSKFQHPGQFTKFGLVGGIEELGIHRHREHRGAHSQSLTITVVNHAAHSRQIFLIDRSPVAFFLQKVTLGDT
jgi:hypothetical protein